MAVILASGFKRACIYFYLAKSPQIVREIVASNGSHSSTKPSTPAPPARSLSTEVTTTTSSSSHSNHSSSSSSAFKVSHPSRKYFDSGDYELARAGILSSASVGSIHPSADKLLASSASRSTRNSRDELAIIGEQASGMFCRNLSAPNTATHLQKSNFSMASVNESDAEVEMEIEVDRRMEF